MEALLLALRLGYSPRGVPSQAAGVGDLASLTGCSTPVEEGVGVILAAFRPLGRPGVETISLREWAVADASMAPLVRGG